MAKRTRLPPPTNLPVANFPKKTKQESNCSLIKEAREIDKRDLRKWSVECGLKGLAQGNRQMAEWINTHDMPRHLGSPNVFLPSSTDGVPNWFPSLFKTIVSQQLATAAARTVHGRCMNAYGVKDGDEITAQQVIDAEYTTVVGKDGKQKQVVNGVQPGLSGQKVKYVIALAEHMNDERLLKGVDLESLSDEELHSKLIAVKGLGKWSVEMFQIFKLRRQDIFSVGDLAVRKGLGVILHNNPEKFESSKGRTDLEKLAATKFSPWRSLLCMYAYSAWDDWKEKK